MSSRTESCLMTRMDPTRMHGSKSDRLEVRQRGSPLVRMELPLRSETWGSIRLFSLNAVLEEVTTRSTSVGRDTLSVLVRHRVHRRTLLTARCARDERHRSKRSVVFDAPSAAAAKSSTAVGHSG